MHSLADYNEYKNKKRAHGSINDQLSTPLHLAANSSMESAIKLLLEDHDYDVNILINKNSFLIDLLDNSGLKDFNIL